MLYYWNYILNTQNIFLSRLSWLYLITGSFNPVIKNLSDVCDLLVLSSEAGSEINDLDIITEFRIPLVIIESSAEDTYYCAALASSYSVFSKHNEVLSRMCSKESSTITRSVLHAASLVKSGYVKYSIVPMSIAKYLGLRYRDLGIFENFKLIKGRRCSNKCLEVVKSNIPIKTT